MGTWGYGPFDNDTAGDMAAGMARRVDSVIEGKHKYGYDEARAAAQFLMLSHGTDILGGPGLDNVIKLLVKMRQDTEFLADCREPKQMAAVLEKELLAVFARMRACKGCRKSHSKKEWAELESVSALACSSPVPPSTIFHKRRKMRKIRKSKRRL